MGRKLKQQRRGKGSNAYTKLPNTFDANVKYSIDREAKVVGEVSGFFNSTGHVAPIMSIIYDDSTESTLLAPEGIRAGDKIYVGYKAHSLGSVLRLSDIPKGVPIYNIELRPGDGGKAVRTAGSSAFITAHGDGTATVKMPSKGMVTLDGGCRAQLGLVAGGGFLEQPLVKAGKNFYIKHALNRLWPTGRGVKMSPVDHPFGGKQHHKGKSSMTSRNAPPGRKVGHIAARRVGRRK
jgi:large subunit ribosomal protein L2